MNYFLKIRFGVWIVIILTAINLATLGTILYKNYKIRCENRDNHDHLPAIKNNKGSFMQRELSLTPEQEAEFKDMRIAFFSSAKILFDSLEYNRLLLVRELIQFNGDTTDIYKTTDEMGRIYGLIKHNTAKHILRLRSKCTPEQVIKLDSLYYKIIRPDGPIPIMRRHMPGRPGDKPGDSSKWPKPRENQ